MERLSRIKSESKKAEEYFFASTAIATKALPESSLVQTSQEKEPVKNSLEKELQDFKQWAGDYVDYRTKKCADFKNSLYRSSLDLETKDLMWKTVLVSSEYCFKVDEPQTKKQ